MGNKDPSTQSSWRVGIIVHRPCGTSTLLPILDSARSSSFSSWVVVVVVAAAVVVVVSFAQEPAKVDYLILRKLIGSIDYDWGNDGGTTSVRQWRGCHCFSRVSPPKCSWETLDLDCLGLDDGFSLCCVSLLGTSSWSWIRLRRGCVRW